LRGDARAVDKIEVEQAMKIIDAQVHIWSSGKPIGAHRQVESYSATELLAEMAAAGVDGAVLHPPGWDPSSNALAIDAVLKNPGKFAILGNFPLNDPKSQALVKDWKAQPGMVGLRFALVQPEQQRWVRDGTMDWLWPAAEKADLPVATMAGRFLPEFAVIAERHPNLRLIVDHLGLVRSATDEAAFANLDALLALAKFPNVSIKATGAPAYSTQPYPFRNLHDGLHRIFDAFGPRRFFWGTDITRMPCSYRECVTLFTEELPWLAGDELDLVMGRGFCDHIGFKLPGD
jgi:predicted TIM-barrel fold metal-dependent hydrolase